MVTMCSLSIHLQWTLIIIALLGGSSLVKVEAVWTTLWCVMVKTIVEITAMKSTAVSVKLTVR